MEENYFIRQVFLTQFIKGLIVNSKISDNSREKITNISQMIKRKEVPLKGYVPIVRSRPMQMPIPLPPVRMQPRMMPATQKRLEQNNQTSFEEGRGKFAGFQKSMKTVENSPKENTNLGGNPNNVMETPIVEKTHNQNMVFGEELSKVTTFLHDPLISAVECKGDGQNLLVNRQGNIEVTQMILTKDDIDGLLNEISKKTRIPIVPGVFKAAFDSYIITAVISDFVGKRFIIQKRPNPGQAPQYYQR